MHRTVAIDCFPESVAHYQDGYAIVAVDVIRATTTAITGVAAGRKCYPVPSLETAVGVASKLDRPLLVGEVGGDMPENFDLPNSPARLTARTDVERPMVLLSTTGTRVIWAARKNASCYIACLRNYRAVVQHLARNHAKVAVIGAGSRDEFREEDQLCCAWIARDLLAQGFAAANERTTEIVRRWQDAPLSSFLVSNSVAYLRRSGQMEDLDFVLSHVDDFPFAVELKGEQLVVCGEEERLPVAVAAAQTS